MSQIICIWINLSQNITSFQFLLSETEKKYIYASSHQEQSQESSKHALATRLYKAVETAYSSVYELTEVLNEIGHRYKAPALKALGNQSVNLQASIEGMPGLLDGKHEKEDVIRFMGLMDEITND